MKVEIAQQEAFELLKLVWVEQQKTIDYIQNRERLILCGAAPKDDRFKAGANDRLTLLSAIEAKLMEV